MLYELFTIIAPVFICSALGIVWSRARMPFDNEFVTRLMTEVATPCLIFGALVRLDLTVGTLMRLGVGCLVTTGLTVAVALPVMLALKRSPRAFLPPMMFPNCGNIGLPICLFAFGDEGLALAVSFFAVQAILMFTVGIGISSGKIGLKQLARSPIIYAVALAVVCVVFGIKVPRWIVNTVQLVGDASIPLMLLALGVSLANLKISTLMDSTVVAVARLAVGFAVAVPAAYLLGLSPIESGVLIIQSSMPVAVFSYLFSLRYQREPEAVAGAVVISTVISFATMPALLWFVLDQVVGR